MPFVTAGRENSAAIRIYYEDHGSGPPVVLVHGYALNGHSWEKQEAALLAAGHRVISYDRRGFGASSRPSTGYDFDTLAADLHVLLSRLDLRGVVLAGFALGTGEVARYLALHGPGRVKAAVLVAPLLPFLLKTNDNPAGIDRSVFDGIAARITADRPAAMKDFLDRSYNVDLLGGDRVSDQAWQNSFYVALSASAHAALGCVTACLEDFRGDLATISIPVLVIHGDQDRVLPYQATSSRLPALLKNARSTVIAGGPHAIIWTHADEVNQALLHFIGHPAQRQPAQRPGGPAAERIAERAGRLTLRCDRMSRLGFRVVRTGSRTAVMAGGLSGDQVELVAFDVGEGRPAELVSLDVAEPLGAQAQQSFGLGVEGVADDVEVQAVLDGLRLRHLIERDMWPAGVAVAGEEDRALGSGVFGNLTPEDIGPEPGQGSGVGAVKGDCEQRIGHDWYSLSRGVGYASVRQGLAWTMWRLTCRKERRPGFCAVPAGRRVRWRCGRRQRR